MVHHETRSQGARSTGGSFSSIADDSHLSDTDRQRDRAQPRRAHGAVPGLFSTAASIPPTRLARRPSAPAHSGSFDSAAVRDRQRVSRDDGRIYEPSQREGREDRDGSRLVPPAPSSLQQARGRDADDGDEMLRSRSGPIDVGRSKVHKLVGDLEVVSQSDPKATSLKPPGITSSSSSSVVAAAVSRSLEGAAAGFPAMSRSRSASSTGNKDLRSSHRGAATAAPPVPVPSSHAAKPAATQVKLSLRARIFGFKSSKTPTHSTPSSATGSPVIPLSDGSRDPVAAVSSATVSPSLRSDGLLSPAPSAHEFHGSDHSDAASLAPSVRSDSYAASMAAGPRRSASVSSSAGRSHVEHGATAPPLPGSRRASLYRQARPRTKADSLRQKVSASSLRRLNRSPSPSVSTTSSSTQQSASSGAVDSAYQQTIGRRGLVYTKQIYEDTAAELQTPPPAALSSGHAGDERVADACRPPPESRLAALQLDLQHPDVHMLSGHRSGDDDGGSSQASLTPNYPVDSSFLVLSSSAKSKAWAAASAGAGTAITISEREVFAGEGGDEGRPNKATAADRSKRAAARGAPMPPPTRTPPPIPSGSVATDAVVASSSSATLQPSRWEATTSALPVTPSTSTGTTIAVAHGLRPGSHTPSATSPGPASASDDRSVTPTARSAAPVGVPMHHGSDDAAASSDSDPVGGVGDAPGTGSWLRQELRDGGMSRQPSNASSEGGYDRFVAGAGSPSGPLPFLPRSSSLHGQGGGSDAASMQSARSSTRWSSQFVLFHGSPQPFSSPTSQSGAHRGSATAASPKILPRTTSSSAIAGAGRPGSSHGSPKSPPGFARQAAKISRPRTADSSLHCRSSSYSGMYDHALSSSTIAEEPTTATLSHDSSSAAEAAAFATPLSDNARGLWREWHASIGSSPQSTTPPPPVARNGTWAIAATAAAASAVAAAVTAAGIGGALDPNRPGLPPKNPLRSQCSSNLLARSESNRSVSSPVFCESAKRHPFAFASPGLAAETSESAMSAWQTRRRDSSYNHAGPHSDLAVSPWMDSPDGEQADQSHDEAAEDRDLDHGSAARPAARLCGDAPYVRHPRRSANLGIGLGEDAGLPKSLSAGALTTLSPQVPPWMSEEAIVGEHGASAAAGGASAGAGQGGVPVGVTLVDEPYKGSERGGMAQSSSKRSKLMLSSAFRSGRNRSKTVDAPNDAHDAAVTNSDKRKKEGGAGSKIWSFAREFGGGDHDVDIASGHSSLRKSRGIRKVRNDSIRPQIRRVFDNEHPEAGLAASVHSLQGNGDEAGAADGRLGPPALGDGGSLALGDGGLQRSPSSTSRREVEAGSLSPSAGAFGARAGGWAINRDNLDDRQKRIVKRWYVLRELLETERSYASDLAVARDVYLARARMLAGVTASASPLSPSSSGFFNLTAPHRAPGHLATLSPPPPLPPPLRPPPPRPPQLLGQPPVIMHPSAQSPVKHLLRHTSAESNPHALGGAAMTIASTSPASLTSSNPSNRSSTYTVSSLSSQTSDGATHPLPPLPSGVAAARGAAPPMSPNGAAPLPPPPPPPPHSTSAAAAPSSSSHPRPSIGSAEAAGTPSISRFANPSSTSLGSGSAPSTSSTPISSTPANLFPARLSGVASAGTNTPDAPLSIADVRIIFAQLEQCAALADEMTAVLEVAVGSRCVAPVEEVNALLSEQRVHEKDEDDRVGDAFLRLMPRIDQVYAAYCTRHEAAMARLQELTASQPKVAAFFNECTMVARKHTNAWDLSSLLIKPVQRVLKYPLLIQEVLSSTSDEHPDHGNLHSALAEIQKVADHINEVKKRQDLVDQIVTGRTARRSGSQKAQHGTIKKIKRQQDKIKTAVVGPPPDVVAEDEEAYRALVAQLYRLENGIAMLPRQCLDWCEALRGCYLMQIRLLERWRRVYLLDSSLEATAGVDERLVALAAILKERLLDQTWQQLDGEIRSSIVPVAQRIGQLFANPKSIVSKRNDRELDYARYRSETLKSNGKAPDRKLAESAGAFLALHTQLMDELPQFIYGVQSLVDICVESLARLQAAHHLRVQKCLIEFWREHAWADKDEEIQPNPQTGEASMRHLNPVKMFWEVHSNIAAYAETLQIVSRRAPEVLSATAAAAATTTSARGGFSPLQLRGDLPKPEFTPPAPAGVGSQFTPMPHQLSISRPDDELSSRQSFRTASGSIEQTPMSSPSMGTTSLLGSPVQLGATLGHIDTGGRGGGSGAKGYGGASGPPSQSSQKISSSGSSSGIGSPSGGASKSVLEGASSRLLDEIGDTDSIPPTPISKDTPVRKFAARESADGTEATATAPTATATATTDKRISLPVLPALSFSTSETLFAPGEGGPNEGSFLDIIAEGSGSTSDQHDELRSIHTPSIPSLRTLVGSAPSSFSVAAAPGIVATMAPATAPAAVAASAPVPPKPADVFSGARQVLSTMAAVTDSPDRSAEASSSSLMGFALLSYSTGDLFHVLHIDAKERRYLFGKMEHGETGWVERSAFVPLL
ncbi:hypothetical protein ACQY0O_004835 [Thecaphora frezii]